MISLDSQTNVYFKKKIGQIVIVYHYCFLSKFVFETDITLTRFCPSFNTFNQNSNSQLALLQRDGGPAPS